MNTAPDCVPCILSQLLVVARRVNDDDWLHRKILKEAADPLLSFEDHLGPSELANETIRKALRTMGAQHPFAEDRRAHIEMATALAARLAERIAESPDPLGAALVVAAAANGFDRLLIDPEVDVVGGIEASIERGLATSDGDDLRAELAGAKKVLYVFDTAGEVPFDLLLIERLGERDITAAVRPAQGRLSATLDDAAAAGVPERVPVVEAVAEGSGSFALDSPEFRGAFAEADLVIAKGLGSYELLQQEEDKPVFVLLSVKCAVAARLLGVPVGGLVLTRP